MDTGDIEAFILLAGVLLGGFLGTMAIDTIIKIKDWWKK